MLNAAVSRLCKSSMLTCRAMSLVSRATCALALGCVFACASGQVPASPRIDAAPAGPPAAACKRTGCSGQICASEEAISTCEFRPEYACYKSAACERQPNGACGFTRTPALDDCLARSASH